MYRLVLPCLVAIGLFEPIHAFQERRQPVTGGGFTVVVDAVITDSSNRIVRKLTTDDLEIWEDGVLQKIDACKFIGSEQERGTADIAVHQPESSVQVKPGVDSQVGTPVPATRQARRIIALLLDYGGTDVTAQNLIDKSVQQFIESDVDEKDLVGIFVLDPGFRLLHDFTYDRAALKNAIARRRLTGFSLYRMKASDLRDMLPLGMPGLRGADSDYQARLLLFSGALTAPDGPELAALEPQARALALMVIRHFLTMLTHVQRGQANTYLSALKAIFAGLEPVEARKAVLLFSPGFVIDSTNEWQLFRAISAANRSDVVVYALDPQGLDARAVGGSLLPRGELAYTGSAHQGRNAIGGESVFDRARVAGSDVRDSLLRYLTAETGGFAVRNTNDLAAGLVRIKEELESYYVLSYRPERQTYDGLYRKIEVRTRKQGLTVRYRPGYVALPKGYETLTSEEFKLVKAAEQGSSSEWPVFVEADVFHPTEVGPNVLLTVDVPFRQLQLVPEEPSKQDAKRNASKGPLKSANVYLVGLVRDSSGAVLQRFGEPINLHLDPKRIAELRDGHVSMTSEFTLLPGRYSLLIYTDDRNSPEKHALIEHTVSVPPISEELLASSLVLGRHVARSRDASLSAAGGIKLSPTADHAFKPGERAVAFLRLYNLGTDSRGFCDVDLKFTLKRAGSGQAVQARPLRLSERPNEKGELPVMRFLELARVPQGAYLLEAQIDDNLKHSSISKTAQLTVVP